MPHPASRVLAMLELLQTHRSMTGGDLDACARKNRAVLSFPERLKLFLEQTGYAF